MTKEVKSIIWETDKLLLLDQRCLPETYTYEAITTSEEMAEAIRSMMVRGAPAIGVAAAYGMYLGARDIASEDKHQFITQLEAIAKLLRETRPTAVNLFWAIARVMKAATTHPGTVAEIKAHLLNTAEEIFREDIATCKAIGEHGLNALPKQPHQLRILTHCNTGALATAGYGTALGVIRSAWHSGRLEKVYADETRPRLQGAKLTAWECVEEGIPVTVLTDGMAAHCMSKGMIDAAIVGADRIAINGDTANKIGTYSLAVVARAHNIPFYVAAPLSTVDFQLSDGSGIPIEQRSASEIYRVGETIICPEGVDYYNPAFDVTPAHLISAIVTEHGAFAPSELSQYQHLSIR